MTRINVGIPPVKLIDQHLIAEYRELPRVATLVRKRIEKKQGFEDIPPVFSLNKGHMLFFADKGEYLFKRWVDIRNEMDRRGFKSKWAVQFEVYDEYHLSALYNDYIPTQRDTDIMIERLTSVILNRFKSIPRYYSKQVTKEQATQILIND